MPFSNLGPCVQHVGPFWHHSGTYSFEPDLNMLVPRPIHYAKELPPPSSGLDVGPFCEHVWWDRPWTCPGPCWDHVWSIGEGGDNTETCLLNTLNKITKNVWRWGGVPMHRAVAASSGALNEQFIEGLRLPLRLAIRRPVGLGLLLGRRLRLGLRLGLRSVYYCDG